jgi:hypothetical protein
MLFAAAALVLIMRDPMARSASAVALLSLAMVFAWPGLNQSRRVSWSRLPMLAGSVALAWGGA